jgi:hypothetical protein
MSHLHKSLRLGDLLVEKGLITTPQLRQAIELQRARYDSVKISSIHTKHELGEILIELGYISRHQLSINLSWQRRLKATTAMMVFVAPLLTAACGGGGGGGGSPSQQSGAVASSQIGATKNSSSSFADPSDIPLTSSSKAITVSSAPKSSFASSSQAAENLEGPVQLLWSVPTSRENGEYLDISEIGGYEIRYKSKTDADFSSVVIKDAYIDSYYFDYLKGDYQFEIATFDNTGLYSKFIPVGVAN